MVGNLSQASAFEKDFNELEERERLEFLAKLNYAMLHMNSCYKMAINIISFADKYGVFDGAKHGVVEANAKSFD